MVNLQQLFKAHDAMENHIKNSSDIKEDALGKENISDLRFLALQVKVGELASMTKCYKYSRMKENLSKEKLMTGYIEAMKFLLSIGNINNFNIINFDNIVVVDDKSSIIKVFSNIFEYINEVRELSQNNNYIDALNAYIRLFEEFIKLSFHLSFTIEEVSDSYKDMVCQIIQAC